MRDVRITVMKVAHYDDLIAAYEAWEPDPCRMREGMVFLAKAGARPEGLCDSAWETLAPFVGALAAGLEGPRGFFDGWMKNPASAMVSCNDGFRPVSFLVEAVEEGVLRRLPVCAGNLAPFDGQPVRIVTDDGVFEGECEWNPADFGLVAYDREEEILQIDDWIFFAGDIREVQVIPAAEPPATYRWMGRVQHAIQLDAATFAALEAKKTDILCIRADEAANRGIQTGHVLRLVWAGPGADIDREEVLRYGVRAVTPGQDGTTVLQLEDLIDEGEDR